MKTLKDILKDFEYEILNIEDNNSITNNSLTKTQILTKVEGIAFDSRKIQINYLFVAEKGELTDGHLYIDKAIANGATIIVFDEKDYTPSTRISSINNQPIIYIKVKSSSFALAQIAKNYYNNPSKNLILVGVTGTNGKTTTVTLLYELFTLLGHRCGKISTVENIIVDTILPTERTTPDSITLNQLLSEMVTKKCEYVFMEVSSHAVVQNRIAGLNFKGAVFSNITLDHLDYHKTFAAYIKAKKKFFDDLSYSAFALTNIDDKNGEVMLQNTKARCYTYSLQSAKSDFKAKILESTFEGMELVIDNKEIFVPMTGKFNAYNLLAVYSVAVLLGVDKMEILKHLTLLKAAK